MARHPDPRIANIAIAFIDGFLAALMVGPRFVEPNRWLANIFGRRRQRDGRCALRIPGKSTDAVARHGPLNALYSGRLKKWSKNIEASQEKAHATAGLATGSLGAGGSLLTGTKW